jgi:hypothetical protein
MADYLKNLTEEQAQVANEIVSKAKQMGVDPKLAVALAYRESRLNPNTKNGTSGEIGLMQVMPSTAKGMGFSVDDLRDPSKNIEIGLTYLKQGLEKFGDPMLAVAGYNAGHNHPYFTDPENKSLPESTKEYLREIVQNGGFEPTPAQEEGSGDGAGGAGGGDGGPPPGGDLNEFKMRMLMDAAGVTGGAIAGKVSDVGRGVIGGARDIVRASRTLPGALGVMESMTRGAAPTPPMPSAPAMPSAPPAALQAGAPRPVAGGPAGPVGGPAAPLTQMGGPGAYNYGKAFGLTDIEAGRATDMSKQPGGASDLIAKRTEALQKIQNMGGGFVENPNYGGIMTPQQGAGGGPRASFVQAPGGLSQLPPTTPISAAPPPPPPGPGPLSQAAGALKQGAGAVLRSPLAQGALGGLSIAESAQEADRQFQAKDATGTAIAGAGIVGGGMQIFGGPKAKAIGALVSAASPLTLYLRNNLRNQTPMPDPTEQEMMEAQRPAFMYARP